VTNDLGTVAGSPWPVVGMGLFVRPRDIHLAGAGRRALLTFTCSRIAAACRDDWCGQQVSTVAARAHPMRGVCYAGAAAGLASTAART
jgi:hypothetical protein